MEPKKWMLYKKLELIPDSVPESGVNEPNLSSWLGSIWQSLVDTFTRGHEPKIWQKRDRVGNTWWYAHNPATGQTACLASEEEVRIWLDQHYRIG